MSRQVLGFPIKLPTRKFFFELSFYYNLLDLEKEKDLGRIFNSRKNFFFLLPFCSNADFPFLVILNWKDLKEWATCDFSR